LPAGDIVNADPGVTCVRSASFRAPLAFPILLILLLLPMLGGLVRAAEARAARVGSLQDLTSWVEMRHGAAAQRLLGLVDSMRIRQDEHAEAMQRLVAALDRNASLLAARRAIETSIEDPRQRAQPGRALTRSGRIAALAARGRDDARSPRTIAHLRALLSSIESSGSAASTRSVRSTARDRGLATGLAALSVELRRHEAELAKARRALLDLEREHSQLLNHEAALGRQLAELRIRSELAEATPALAASAAELRPPIRAERMLHADLVTGAPMRELLVSARASVVTAPRSAASDAFGGGPERPPPVVTVPFFLPIAGARIDPDGQESLRYRRGLLLAGPAPQTVSAPCDGEIVFAEPFKGFGPLLIIDRGDGYHILLSGFSQLGVSRGARVVAGQALGAVGVEGGAGRLYLELRRHGSPVDPTVWLALPEDKVRS
jgi:murein DD-endopeptidase MepM/ murein hydrolase activator NlpD